MPIQTWESKVVYEHQIKSYGDLDLNLENSVIYSAYPYANWLQNMIILKGVPPNRKSLNFPYHFKIFEFSPKMSSKTSMRFESNPVKKLHFQKHCKTLRSVTDKRKQTKKYRVSKKVSHPPVMGKYLDDVQRK